MDKKTVNQVRGLLSKGLSSRDAANKLRLSVQQVAAVRAHQTMQSYDSDPVKISESDKLRIVALVKQGLSSGQIRKRIKRYNHQQIAAVKAWVTMGKY